CGLLALTGCAAPAQDGANVAPDLHLSGGDTTTLDASRDAFSLAARNLTGERRDRFFVGNSLFNRGWVTAPATTTGMDGLGPTFNARSCSACHFKDGRGAPPQRPDETMVGLLLRLSVPGNDPHGGPLPDPTYGDQLNEGAVLGVRGEGRGVVTYDEQPGNYPDGAAYSLRVPRYSILAPAFGALRDDLLLSPRVAPAVFGLGLLQAVAQGSILALADADDENGDGVSGRPNWVYAVASDRLELGRFGWKANQPSLEQQNAGAFLGDMGITSPLFPRENCPEPQTACRHAKSGGEPEIDSDVLQDVTYYTHLLAVPARRNVDAPTVRKGSLLFEQFGCASCHVPTLETDVLEGFPELSGQTIHPYTDLLLHDMGDELTDGRPDFEAQANEWRTPPLWGIGLVGVVNRHTTFLHDGRARSLEEAILWHAGEAAKSRDAFRNAKRSERELILEFLESL
ncbi:MAG TPA: di-heme oxidoredictase family protein, partial [Polyangiaceae bacterium]|nr:di-heme oxidoredictase family protein [Polyangiaceae bacterium]